MKYSARWYSVIVLSLSLVLNLIQPALASDLSVTATVPANQTAYSLSITTDSGTVVGQDQTITYTLNYGTTLSSNAPLTIKAQWTRGTVEGSSDPSVDVLNYVANSATDAYGGAPPLIDTVNRTITWTIPNFPAATSGQEVAFKLHTSSTLLSVGKIDFTVSSQLEGPGVVTSPVEINQQFTTGNPPQPTSTPTPVQNQNPTPTPGSGSSTTPTPTPLNPRSSTPPAASEKLVITDVTIQTIGPDHAGIAVALSLPAGVSINYGTSLSQLNQTISDPSIRANHLVILPNLSPGTAYYFQVIATYQGQKATSDFYTVITGEEGEMPSPVISTLVVSSENTILTSPLQIALENKPGATSTLLLPVDSVYEFRISILNSQNLKLAQAVVRNHNILGFSPFIGQADASTDAVDLIEISPHIFAGKLKTALTPGSYDLFIRLYDVNGNIAEKKVAEIRVLSKFTVLNRRTKKPIEAAKILLYYWDSQKKAYKLLQPGSTSIMNPSHTDNNGFMTIILPRGTYQAKLTNVNYETKVVTFTLGDKENEGYPTVYMEEKNFSLLTAISYYSTNVSDLFWPQTVTYVSNLALSQRMLDLTGLIGVLCFILLLILSLSRRIQISFFALPSYLIYLYKRTFAKSTHICVLKGQVLDSTSDQPLENCMIYVRDQKTDRLIGHATSNSQGKFTIAQLCEGPYSLLFLKQGLRPFTLSSVFPGSIKQPILVSISTRSRQLSFFGELIKILEELLAAGFEVIMVLALLFSLAIGSISSLTEALPLTLLTGFNLVTWLLHRRNHKEF